MWFNFRKKKKEKEKELPLTSLKTMQPALPLPPGSPFSRHYVRSHFCYVLNMQSQLCNSTLLKEFPIMHCMTNHILVTQNPEFPKHPIMRDSSQRMQIKYLCCIFKILWFFILKLTELLILVKV